MLMCSVPDLRGHPERVACAQRRPADAIRPEPHPFEATNPQAKKPRTLSSTGLELRQRTSDSTRLVVVEIGLIQLESLSKRTKLRRHSGAPADIKCEISRAGLALMTAMRWAKTMEANSMNRADIARHEGISRARVTQLMSLLHRLAEVKTDLLEVGEATRGWSIKRALRAVSQ